MAAGDMPARPGVRPAGSPPSGCPPFGSSRASLSARPARRLSRSACRCQTRQHPRPSPQMARSFSPWSWPAVGTPPVSAVVSSRPTSGCTGLGLSGIAPSGTPASAPHPASGCIVPQCGPPQVSASRVLSPPSPALPSVPPSAVVRIAPLSAPSSLSAAAPHIASSASPSLQHPAPSSRAPDTIVQI